MSDVSQDAPPAAGVLHDFIGHTPLVNFPHFLSARSEGTPTLWGKLEGFNPAGSAKDRTAYAIVAAAKEQGILTAGTTVVESSSGNLGVALAREAALDGWDFHCVVDPKTNRSTISYMQAFGATVHEVTAPDPQTGDWLTARRSKVAKLLAEVPGAINLDQYSNVAAFKAHSEGTMREIVDTLGRAPDYLVVAVSTTGTVGGCLRYIRDHNLPTKVIAVDAEGSVLFDGKRGERHLPGFGAGMVPALSQHDHVVPDRVVRVSDIDSVQAARSFSRAEGYLIGASGGAVAAALLQIEDTFEPDAVVAAIFHDSGVPYLDTVYNDEWVLEHIGKVPASREVKEQD